MHRLLYYRDRARRATKILRNLSGFMEKPTAGNFGNLQRRVEELYSEKTRRRVLLVSSNGAGLGHLTRLNAISNQLESETLIYTMSSAYKQIGRPPGSVIYFPSYGDLGMDGRTWNAYMTPHFESVVRAFDPDCIVFDGTYVYQGVTKTADKLGIPLYWIQRGCWKEDVDRRSKQRHRSDTFCDGVVIPGDYGCDERVKVGSSFDPFYVNPIVSIEGSQLLSREEARKELKLPADKKLVLVQTGAGTINNIENIGRKVVDSVSALGDGWSAVSSVNPLGTGVGLPGALAIRAFPLARYLKAFEFGVFAAGYNSVQESVEFRLPAAFIPNLETKTDDQLRRAEGIRDRGLGKLAQTEKQLKEAIVALSTPVERTSISEAMEATVPASGAHETAAFLDKQIDAANGFGGDSKDESL